MAVNGGLTASQAFLLGLCRRRLLLHLARDTAFTLFIHLCSKKWIYKQPGAIAQPVLPNSGCLSNLSTNPGSKGHLLNCRSTNTHKGAVTHLFLHIASELFIPVFAEVRTNGKKPTSFTLHGRHLLGITKRPPSGGFFTPRSGEP